MTSLLHILTKLNITEEVRGDRKGGINNDKKTIPSNKPENTIIPPFAYSEYPDQIEYLVRRKIKKTKTKTKRAK